MMTQFRKTTFLASVAIAATLALQSTVQAGFALGLGNYTSLSHAHHIPRPINDYGNGGNMVNGVIGSNTYAQTFHIQTITQPHTASTQTYTLNTTALSFAYELNKIAGGGYTAVIGMNNLTKFAVTANATYNLTSSYSVSAIQNTGSTLVLRDTSTSTILVSDAGSSYTGSFLLLAGRTYQLSYDFSANGPGAQSITTGSYSLTQAASSVPEPASLAMWGLGVLGMMFARRKRQQMMMAV